MAGHGRRPCSNLAFGARRGARGRARDSRSLEAQERQRPRPVPGTYRKLARERRSTGRGGAAGPAARRARSRRTRSLGRSGGHFLRSDSGSPELQDVRERDASSFRGSTRWSRSERGYSGDPCGSTPLDGPLVGRARTPGRCSRLRLAVAMVKNGRSGVGPAREARERTTRGAMTSRRRSCSRPGRSRALRSRGAAITGSRGDIFDRQNNDIRTSGGQK